MFCSHLMRQYLPHAHLRETHELLIESERSERSEHTVVLSLRFLSIYTYIIIVTKILRKIRATTFTEKLRKITRDGERLG